MNSAVRCIILLACVAICSSAAIINCQCVATIPGVHPSLIIGVKHYPPRPYCNRHEVIVTLKDKTTHCLNPEQPLTKKIVQREEMRRAKMNANRTKTTVPATPPATVLATEVSTTL